MPNTVIAAGDDYEQDEAEADAAITPGYLVEETGTGVAPHGTAAGDVTVTLFAREHQETGMDIDDDIPAGSNAKYIRPSPGMRVRARIAAAETITAGDDLVSNGDGTLRAAAGDGTESAGHVATAYEDIDTTDGNVGLAQVRVA